MKMKTSIPSSASRNQIRFHPWIYFGIFLVSNTLLSYFSFSIVAKCWIYSLGLILPLTIGIKTVFDHRSRKNNLLFIDENIFEPSLWLWIFFILLLALTRFYRLTTLPFWPLGDEGISSILGDKPIPPMALELNLDRIPVRAAAYLAFGPLL